MAEPLAAMVDLHIDGIFDGFAIGWLGPIGRQCAIGEDFMTCDNDQRRIGVAVGSEPRFLLLWRAQFGVEGGSAPLYFIVPDGRNLLISRYDCSQRFAIISLRGLP